MAYVVNLEKFYGPLDLLLYLIEKNEMDIYDISISKITDQYLEYIQSTGERDLENIGDFLLMASYLLNLKSQMLLPVSKQEDKDEEVPKEMGDPREELVKKLLEYKKYKKAAEILATYQIDNYGKIFYRPGMQEFADEEIRASVNSLLRAYSRVFKKNIIEKQYNIPQGDINVGEKMAEILQRLDLCRGSIVFQDLFTGTSSKREFLGLFLALLELLRLRKVEAVQIQRFGDIKIYRQVGNNADA